MTITSSFWRPLCDGKLLAADMDKPPIPEMRAGLRGPVKDTRRKLALVAVYFLAVVGGLSALLARDAAAAEVVCSRSDILFCEDFTNLTTGQTSTGWYDWDTVSEVPIVDTTFGRASNRSLRQRIPANTLYAGVVRHTLPMNINTGESLYVRFYAYWSAGFKWVPGGSGSKFIYFNSWNGGTSNWRIRFSYQNIQGRYVDGANPDAGGILGFDSEPIDDHHDANQPGPITFLPAQWYCVEVYSKLNTPGSSNGEVKWWVSDVLQGSYTNFAVRGSHSEPINGISFDQYFGGAVSEVGPHPEQYVWFDDVVASTAKIGCNSSAAALPAPTGLAVR